MMLKPAVAATSMIKNIFVKKDIPVGSASADQVGSPQQGGNEALVQQARQERINFRRDVCAIFSLLQPLYSVASVLRVSCITYNVGQSAPTAADVERIFQLADRQVGDGAASPGGGGAGAGGGGGGGDVLSAAQTLDVAAMGMGASVPSSDPALSDVVDPLTGAPATPRHLSPRARHGVPPLSLTAVTAVSDEGEAAVGSVSVGSPLGGGGGGGGSPRAAGTSGGGGGGGGVGARSGPDVYAIALQEVDMSTAAVALSLASTDKRNDQKTSGKVGEWVMALSAGASARGAYHRIATKGMCGLLVVVMVRVSLLPFVKDVSIDMVKLGKAGLVGNKAGIGVRFVVHGRAFVFVGTHLAPHREGFDRRNKQYHTILREMRLKRQFLSDDLWLSLPSVMQWWGGIPIADDVLVHQSPSIARGAGDRSCIEDDVRAEVCGSGSTVVKDTDRDLPELLQHGDYVWWMGDLNYRVWRADAHENINRAREGKLAKTQADEEKKIGGKKDKKEKEAVDLLALAKGEGDALEMSSEKMTPFDRVVAGFVELGDFASLQLLDQLSQARRMKLAFDIFHEPPILFPPTYKYTVGADVYDAKKWRTPSYADRILYYVRPVPPHPRLPAGLDSDLQGLLASACDPYVHRELRCTQYTSAHNVRLSDHRPVVGVYEVAVAEVDYERAVHVACDVADGVYRMAGAQFAAAVAEDKSRLRALLGQIGKASRFKDEKEFTLKGTTGN